MRSLPWLVVAVFICASCGDNYPQLAPDAGPPRPQCSDAKDNDGDGQIDFPADLGCTGDDDDSEDSPTSPRCSDGRDNDGDGKKDYPLDPGCVIPQADDERDDCPNGPNCPQCANGRDDDFNGKRDFPLDPGCASAADNVEILIDPNACGMGMLIKPLPVTGTDTVMFDATMSKSNVTSPCGGGNGAAAVGYVFAIGAPRILVASTDNFGTTATDTVLDVRSAMCSAPASEVACNNDISPSNRKSTLITPLMPGLYYLIVEGSTPAITGQYQLTVQLLKGEGELCMQQSECGPGLVCRTPVGGMNQICTKPVCSDGLDDDADGKIDFPNDPGCTDVADATENDNCPSGPGCPQCADGLDNDGDGQTDYPADSSCSAASSDSESCQGEQDPIVTITSSPINDTMVGAHDNHDPSCGSNLGADKMFILNIPAMATLTISTIGSSFDTVLSLLGSACSEPSIQCDDDSGGSLTSLINRTNVAAGTYVVAVDAYSNLTTLGAFRLNVSGSIAPGGSCEGQLAQAGVITCATGTTCQGPVGARRCVNQCTDGIDNNGDGKTDYPNDPGCSSPADNLEDTVCPGATCPACADGVDNDMDGQTDYPADTNCLAASSPSESCATEQDPIATVTTGTTMGTLVGAHDDHDPTCGSNGGLDKLVTVTLPALSTLTIDTNNSGTSDTILSMLNATCGEPSIQCDDDSGTGLWSLITRTNVAAGTYFFAIDAYSNLTTPGTFVLNLTGVAQPGAACTSPLFAAGALTCAVGQSCVAGVCQ